MPELSRADHRTSPPTIDIPRHYNAAADLIGRNLDAGRGDKTAFIDDRGRCTYAELDRRTDACGNALRALGVQREQRVLMCIHDGIDFPTVFLGAINGTLVTKFKINALIATLATLSVYRGGLQLVSGAGVTNIGNNFTIFGQTKILGIYSPFWFMAVIVILFAFLVGRTRSFRQAYYIGGNARAAKLSGINVDRTVFSFFVIMGFLAGLSGALLASRLNTAVVLAGQGVELKVITAMVLGGARLSGGVGTIFGAFLGVLLMALLQNAMIIAHINPFWQLIVVGIVLLVSVGLDQFARLRLRS